MTLLTKIERLEKITTARDKSRAPKPDPELIEELGRILREIRARPEPTVHQQIGWLRETIKENETLPEPEKFLDTWCRSELARLEATLATHA